MREVTAAVISTPGGPLEHTELLLRDPGPHEVLVRIRASGVCASDVHIIDGRLPKPMPIVPGHEAAGEVVEVGDGVDDLEAGTPVVLSILPRCGRCAACAAGRGNHCDWAATIGASGTLDGTSTGWHRHDGTPVHHFNGVSSFADHVLVPRSGVVPVDPRLPFPVAALLGCAVATGVGAVRNAARVAPGETVAVIGCGGVGLNVIQGARLAGAGRIVAIDRDEAKLALARELGATDAVDARDGDPSGQLHGVLPDGVDHAFDAIGDPEVLASAFAMTAAGGTAVAVGLYATDARLTIPAFPLVGERRVVGTYLGGIEPRIDIPKLARDHLAGGLRLAELVAERPFAEADAAVDELRRGATLARQVLVFD